MLRITTNATSKTLRQQNARRCKLLTNSSKKSKSTTSTNSTAEHVSDCSPKSTGFQGDAGNIATHVHHKVTSFLVFATPAYFLLPTGSSEGGSSVVDKAIGLTLAANLSMHSWVGLNYVITDYVPKVSKALVGPARVATAGLSLVTLIGLGKVSCNDHGGLKGAVTGLWKKKGALEDKEN